MHLIELYNSLATIIPIPLDSYGDGHLTNMFEILGHRIQQSPYNAFATAVFILAILHSFATSAFTKLAHKQYKRFDMLKQKGQVDPMASSILGGIYHFLGEIEAVFGLWALVLGLGTAFFYDWPTFVHYVSTARYVEPMFVIVVMTIASSRPILKLFELILWKIVRLFGGSLEAWWFAILTVGCLLGSIITGPAAMVVSALLLKEKFYELQPDKKLKYATLALLFVNISVGGTLTNFASPPILMIATPWQWSNAYMLTAFGWKAILAIVLSNSFYLVLFRKDLLALKTQYTIQQYQKFIQRKFISKKDLEVLFDQEEQVINERLGFTHEFLKVSTKIKEEIKAQALKTLTTEEQLLYQVDQTLDFRFDDIRSNEMQRTIPGLLPYEQRPQFRDPHWDSRDDKVPYWIMAAHVGFMLWALLNAHEPVLFLAGFLFYLGFYQITAFYQNRLDLKPALMVAFFLAGLVVHGGLQGWWIQPVLASLSPLPLNLMAIALTAFNDNAAITYLCSLVPTFTGPMKYAVVAGAVTGGGLTLIANSPNPIGQSLLKRYFDGGITAGSLFIYALPPTLIAGLCFMLLP